MKKTRNLINKKAIKNIRKRIHHNNLEKCNMASVLDLNSTKSSFNKPRMNKNK